MTFSQQSKIKFGLINIINFKQAGIKFLNTECICILMDSIEKNKLHAKRM